MSHHLGGELDFSLLQDIFLGNGFVDLIKQNGYFLLQFMAVPLHALLPYKGVFVGSGFELRPVYVFDIQRYRAFFCRKQHEQSEDLVQLVFYTASKSVNGDVVRLLIIGQPNKVNVPTQQFLNLAAGIDIVHIGIEITLSIMAG